MPTCGIYCILHRESGDCYVGQARDVAARRQSHFAALARGTHHSVSLQKRYDRDGRSAFAVNVLERCEPEDLNAREYDWMLRLKPRFNRKTPDYAAIAQGAKPDGRLRAHRNPVNRNPSKFLCRCGQIKSLQSRACLTCLKQIARQMVADGYLPESHRFEWEPAARR